MLARTSGEFRLVHWWHVKVSIVSLATHASRPWGSIIYKCDAEEGPQKGPCPVAKCLAPAKGCKLKKEFSKGKNTCCPKPCNYVDDKGNKCPPSKCGIRESNMCSSDKFVVHCRQAHSWPYSCYLITQNRNASRIWSIQTRANAVWKRLKLTAAQWQSAKKIAVVLCSCW